MNRSASVACSGPANSSGQELGDHFRVIAELSGDIAFSIDCPSGHLRYLSDSATTLLGYDRRRFVEQLANSTRDGPLSPLCGGLGVRLQRFGAGDRTRQRVVREFDIPGPAGQLVPVEVVSTLILDEGGTPTALVGLVRDLSARRAREAEQKRFASMLNHEFRTPLSTIDGAIQRLEVTGARADEATRHRYRKIATAVDRLIGMLDDYLSPERMESIGRQRQPTSIDPRQLLDDAAGHAREAGRRVSLAVEQLPASLRCEPEGLRLAFKVLLDNAIQFSPTDSVIGLAGRNAGGGIELAVRDHGPGVPDADLARIFDKFYRGRNAAGLPGSGLGLYMARSVVEVHGGSLSLARPADGGMEFKIWLPVKGTAGKHLAYGEASSDNPTEKPGSAPGVAPGDSRKVKNMTNP